MARINIEDCWWTDPRRAALQRMGVDADGVAVRAWRLAQDFWKHGRALVPKGLFEALDGAAELMRAGLADARETAVYVRGSSAYLDWIAEQKAAAKENGSKGGKVSAQRPRDEKGRLLPKQDPSEAQANPSQSKLSASVSFSGSKREEIESCIEEWGKTLSRLGIKKNPKLDEMAIAQLIARHGYEKTRLALLGAGFEEGSKDYDPKKHVSIQRLLKPSVLDTFVNLGAQNLPADRETQEWAI